MKRSIKIFIINIFSILLLLFVCNFAIYYIDSKMRYNMTIKESWFHYKNFILRDTSPKHIKDLMIYDKWKHIEESKIFFQKRNQ